MPRKRKRRPHRKSDKPHCHGCDKPNATRQVEIAGRFVWLCDSCPTPEEIAERAEEIQRHWRDWQRQRREGHPPVEILEVIDCRRRRRKGRGAI